MIGVLVFCQCAHLNMGWCCWGTPECSQMARSRTSCGQFAFHKAASRERQLLAQTV